MTQLDEATKGAAQAAMAETDAAQTVDLERPLAMVGAPAMGPSPAVRMPMSPSPSMGAVIAPTLEDLYAEYPQLGAGDWRLRVERLSPKTRDGAPCAGVLGDLLERMTFDQFRSKFGPGTYLLSVLVPVDDGGSGRTAYRSRKQLRIAVAGNFAQDEEAMTMPRFVPSDPTVEVARIQRESKREEFERQDRQRLEGRLVEMARPADAQIDTLRDQSKMLFDHVERTTTVQMRALQGEIDHLRGEIVARDNDLKTARDEVVHAKTAAAENLHRVETDKITELRSQWQNERNQLVTMHSERLSEVEKRLSAEIQSIKDRHAESNALAAQTFQTRLDALKEGHESERRRLTEALLKQRQESFEQHQREMASIKETYDRRIEDIKTSFSGQIESLKERRESEVTVIRESESTKSSFAENTFKMQLSNQQTDLERLRDENTHLQNDLNTMRDKLYKDPLQVLTETKDLASKFGMVDASEVPTGSDEPAWMGLIKTGLETASQVIRPIMEARLQQMKPQQPGVHPAQVAQLQQNQQAMAMELARQRQIQASQQSQYVPRQMVQSAAQRQTALPLQSSMPSGMQPATALPLGHAMAAPQASSPAGYAAPAPPEVQPQPQAQAPASPLPIEGQQAEGLKQIMSGIESAFDQSAPAEEVARQLVQSFSPDVVKQLADTYSNAQLIELLLSESGDSSPLANRSGRKYLEEILGHARASLK